MPELPSVELFRQYVEHTSLHQCIAQVTVYDERILDGVTEAELRDALKGQRLQETRRHGKYLFVATDRQWMVMHFGMTGEPVYFRDRNKTPEHTRLLISFDNENWLAFDCQRRLGNVAVTPEMDAFIQRKNLGPDALAVSWMQFRQHIRPKRGMLKPALMDQHTIAGIGNVYADEIVFQLGLHPETSVDALRPAMLRNIYEVMGDILQTAIDRGAQADALPDTYLAPHRREGEGCPRCGTPLQHIRVSGRSSYVCPRHQRKP